MRAPNADRGDLSQPDLREETLTAAEDRLRAAGYRMDFSATSDGRLTCLTCDTRVSPATMRIDQTVRFEGDSNPDDEAILLAIRCPHGCRGLYSAAYGPSTPSEDAAVLQLLASRNRR